MSITGRVIWGSASGARRAPDDPSPDALRRLKYLDWHLHHGTDIGLTCRHFGISRPTLYRWLHRYDPQHLHTLDDRARAPHRRRRPQRSPVLVQAVQRVREANPRWGKDKLVVLLHREGLACSTSMVGRILTELRRRGDLREPALKRISARKRLQQRPHARRKPKDYLALQPGDIVQLDTVDIRTSTNKVFKQFTARDVVSRYDVLEVRSAATAALAADALQAMLQRFPFPVRAIQVDGGSEFMAEFEALCQANQLPLFVLPPRSPKLNGAVERANRTHTEEFYEVYDGHWSVTALQPALLRWESVYNTIRPHQALAYLTPQEWLDQHPPPPLPAAA